MLLFLRNHRIVSVFLFVSMFWNVLLAAALPAVAAPANCEVTFFEDGSYFVECDKDISNVVVSDCEGNHHKHDNLDGTTWAEGNGDPDGTHEAVTVWVKSGNNHSGDGPGYGERFDNHWKDVTVCDKPEEPTPSPTPTETEPSVEPTPSTSTPGPTGSDEPKPEPRRDAPTRLARTGLSARGLVFVLALGISWLLVGLSLRRRSR